MQYREFKQHLKKNQLEKVYFLCGPEEYLLDDCLKDLTKRVVEPATREFNYDLFYAGQTDIGRVIEAANAYPMMSEKRLVVLKDVEKLTASGIKALTRHLQHPSATTMLVLVSPELAGRAKGIAKIKAGCCVVEFKQLYDNQVAGWIKDYVKSQGQEISYSATLLLHSHVGNNLRALTNELEKISLNLLHDSRKIEEEDVQQVVGLSRTYSVFNLNDAIGNKDISKSLLILNKMLASGESSTSILAMVARHYGNLLKIKGGVASGKSQSDLAKMTGIPSFFVSKTKEMAAKYSFEEFSNIFDCLLTTDLTLKTSRQTPRIALQTMLLRILR